MSTEDGLRILMHEEGDGDRTGVKGARCTAGNDGRPAPALAAPVPAVALTTTACTPPGDVIRVLAGGFGAGSRDVAHQVAASLRLSDREPVVLPFNLPGQELQHVALVAGSEFPSGAERVIAEYQHDATVTLVDGQPRDAASVPPNTTIDGRPAYESANRFDVRDIGGRSLTITVPSGGARMIYENLDVVPNIGEWQPDL